MRDRREPLKEVLARAHSALLRVVDDVPCDAWSTSAISGRWSPAEVIAHLIQVERGVLAKAERIIQHEPRRVPLLKRLHLPMALVEARVGRRQSPVPLAQELLGTKEEMLGELRTTRERTQAFLEETRHRNLATYYWQHPALGMLNVYGWMRFLGAHEVRHAKQMREIVHGLPKLIGNLQK